jgi:hypothetical protein
LTIAVKTVARILTPWNLHVYLAVQWHSGRPYTSYPTSTGFETIDGGRFYQNNERMPEYFNADIKVEKKFRFGSAPDIMAMVYPDCRNVANKQNVSWVDSNGRIGGELDDPSGYFIGRRTSIGVQVEF